MCQTQSLIELHLQADWYRKNWYDDPSYPSDVLGFVLPAIYINACTRYKIPCTE